MCSFPRPRIIATESSAVLTFSEFCIDRGIGISSVCVTGVSRHITFSDETMLGSRDYTVCRRTVGLGTMVCTLAAFMPRSNEMKNADRKELCEMARPARGVRILLLMSTIVVYEPGCTPGIDRGACYDRGRTAFLIMEHPTSSGIARLVWGQGSCTILVLHSFLTDTAMTI